MNCAVEKRLDQQDALIHLPREVPGFIAVVAIAPVNIPSNIAAQSTVALSRRGEQPLQVVLLVEQAYGLHLLAQHIVAMADVLAGRHPLEVRGAVVVLVAVFVVHLQAFPPARAEDQCNLLVWV